VNVGDDLLTQQDPSSELTGRRVFTNHTHTRIINNRIRIRIRIRIRNRIRIRIIIILFFGFTKSD
jgi:hypothetical protein